MKNKYKISLGVIFLGLIIVLLIFSGYHIYKNNILKNSAEVIVDDELSINYFNGSQIEFESEEKEIKFSVINDGDSESLFHIGLDNVRVDNGKVTYSLYEENKIIVENSEITEGANTLSSFVSIAVGETKSYKLELKNIDKKKISFEINVQKSSQEDTNFSQLILNDNLINKETKTKVGEEIAVNDEGLILDVDDNGNTFYFRGNVNNNYVKFADEIWRIVRINGNGTIKIVLDSSIGNSTIYNTDLSKDRLETLKKYSETKVAESLVNWYESSLKDYDNYIAQSKYCIDTNMEGENLSNYFRINVSNIPTFNCLGTKNNSKIGLLTVDEIIYAGATINEPNQHYYLYNERVENSWWTLSPAKDSVEGLYYYEVSNDGKINSTSTGESSKNIRPVINLKKDVEMSGDGTKENPYILK